MQLWFPGQGPPARSSPPPPPPTPPPTTTTTTTTTTTATPAVAAVRPAAPRLLILYGPAGAGKSTAVRVLSASLGLSLREWGDMGARGGLLLPSTGDGTESGYTAGGGGRAAAAAAALREREAQGDYTPPFTSVLQDFEEFLSACGVFSPLLLAPCAGAGVARGLPAAPGPVTQPTLVLLEEIPRPRDASGALRLHLVCPLLVMSPPSTWPCLGCPRGGHACTCRGVWQVFGGCSRPCSGSRPAAGTPASLWSARCKRYGAMLRGALCTAPLWSGGCRRPYSTTHP
jgi:hypothetical protein